MSERDLTKPQECEVCGYQAKHSLLVVQLCPDGLWRCHVCRETTMRGRYQSEREWMETGEVLPETEDWKRYLQDLEES